MYDPYETPIEYESEVESSSRRLPVKGVACFLLVVMLCSVITTPLAIFLYWNNNRQEEPPPPTAVPFETTAEEASDGNRIAYITTGRQLATIALDGTDRRQLTDVEQAFQFPAWSPDNSRVAVIGGGQDGAGVFVIPDVPDGELQTLYLSDEGAPIYLYWGPDSNRLSFIASHPAGLGLYIGDVLGDNSRLLTTGQPFYWDWLPDGDQILIHTGLGGEDSRLAVIDPAGDGAGDNISQPGLFQAPGVSANGRYYAYTRFDAERSGQITIFDGESGQPQQSQPHLGLAAMSWSPVNDVLAYIAPTVDAPVFYGPLRTLDAATGEEKTLVDDLIVAFFWSPDGRYIAYLTIVDEEDSAVQASKLGLIGKPGTQADDPLLMAVWVYDTRNDAVRRLLSFEPTDLFVFQFLPFFDQYSRSHRIWSADSQNLVLPIVEASGPKITIIPIDGSPSEAIVSGIMGFWNQ